MPSKSCFCALVEPSAIARSKENTTSSAVIGVPSWKRDALAQVEDPGEPVGRDLPALGQRRQDRAVRREAGQPLEDVGIDDLVDRRRRAGGRVEDAAARAACRRVMSVSLRRRRAGQQRQRRRQRQGLLHLDLHLAVRSAASVARRRAGRRARGPSPWPRRACPRRRHIRRVDAPGPVCRARRRRNSCSRPMRSMCFWS